MGHRAPSHVPVQTILRPWMTLIRTVTMAITRRMWMNPFIVEDVTRPRIHRATRTTAIVYSIGYPFVGSVLRAWCPAFAKHHRFKDTTDVPRQSIAQEDERRTTSNEGGEFLAEGKRAYEC